MVTYDFRCEACFCEREHSQAVHTTNLKVWCDRNELDRAQVLQREEKQRSQQELSRLQEQIGRAEQDYLRWRQENSRATSEPKRSATHLWLVNNNGDNEATP